MSEEVASAEESMPVSTTEPHIVSVVAWEIPSATVVGERFRIKVGIKCSGECTFADAALGIYDHTDARVAVATLGGDAWPGTTGLFAAEVELEAPAEEGLHAWTVKAPESDGGVAHATSSTSFGLRVVSRPEHVVRVEAVDRDSQLPLAGAHVVMHPYKAVTDEQGIAEVRVAKGTYKLFVSQARYLTFGVPIDVTADTTARAELDVEPVLERN
jgi:hypothetical protein